MDLRSIFLYNLLPKKRIFIAFIGFLISSTIITGGGILITNIIESTASYLGETEDVLVISNPAASTPYTSILPLDLAETIKTLHGVIDVSPEVMTAAVYKDTAVYFRGVDVNKFNDFMDINIIEGHAIERYDTYDVSIGVKFAERNTLKVGDFVTVFSTRSDSALEIRIKSIFSSGTLLDDEIIAPLWIGQFFAFESFDYMTHVRVKIDLNIIPNKEILREILIGEHELTVNILTPGNIEELNGTLYIRNSKGNILSEEIFYDTNIIQTTLTFGEYEIQIEIGKEISSPYNFILLQDADVDVFVPYIEREVNIRVRTDENEPIENAEVIIYRQKPEERTSWSDWETKYSDTNGEVTFVVSNGSYFAEAELNRYWKRIEFVTGDINNYEIELIDRHPYIYDLSHINNTIIIGKSVNISISTSNGYSSYFYMDGNKLTLTEYFLNGEGQIPPPGIVLPFDEGPHTITILVFNTDYPGSGDKSRNYAEANLYFKMSQDFPEQFTFNDVMNGSHILPYSTLTFNSSLRFSKDITYSWDKEEWSEVFNNEIPVPASIGVHELGVKTETEDFSKIWFFYFVITYSPDFIGVIGLSDFGKMQNDTLIQIWYDKQATSVFYRWDTATNTPIPQDGIVSAIGLSSGNHTLYLSIFVQSQWYFKSYEIEIDDFSPSVVLDKINGTSIDSGEIISFTSNETLSWLKFSWDNLVFSQSLNNSIKIPIGNGFHSLEIMAGDLAGNIVSYYYEFTVVNFSGTTPIDFYLSQEYAGLLNQSFIDLFVISNLSYYAIEYNIIGPLSSSGTLSDLKRIFLYPGTYTLEITFYLTSFESRIRTWEFKICGGLNSNLLTTQYLNESHSGEITVYIPYFDFSLTMNENSNLFLVDGEYYLVHELSGFPTNIVYNEIIIDTQAASLTIISPNEGSTETSVFLELSSDAVEIFFSLDSETTSYKYEGLTILNYITPGMHTITFTLIDSFLNQQTLSFVHFVGLEYTPVDLIFQFKVGDNVIPYSDLNITFSSYYNDTLYQMTTDLGGRVSFFTLEGEFYISVNISELTHTINLNTNDGDEQFIFIGTSQVTVSLRDYYANVPITYQYCIIRDQNGNRVTSLRSDINGIDEVQIDFGVYTCYFTRTDSKTIIVPFQVYERNQEIIFSIPSPKREIVFEFIYDNGTKIYNLPVIFTTSLEGEFEATTALSASILMVISYGEVNITVFMKNGEIINLRRSFLPGREVIVIVLRSDTGDDWMKIPFKPIGGFEFLVSLSFEYMDYYLKGSLLFTYTLAYAEIILILLVVVINMFTILQNVYRESRKETTVIKMIGGTNFHTITTIFSRLGLIAFICSFLGYGIGTGVLRLLASANQTVFFGHTFTPTGSWGMFFLNMILMIFVATISTLLIARKAKKEKRIVYSKR